MLLVADQTAAFQLTEYPCDILSATVQFLRFLFYGEVKTDRAVLFDKTIDLGDAGSI